MKLKERLLAASLGFVSAIVLLVLVLPFTTIIRTDAGGLARPAASPSTSIKSLKQRQLQKTDGHSEQQVSSDDQQQQRPLSLNIQVKRVN